MPNIDRPDTFASTAIGGKVVGGYECTAGLGRFLVTAPLNGLTYVKDIFYNNMNISVYQVSPRAPLIGFAFSVKDSPAGKVGGPSFTIGRSTVLTSQSDLKGGAVDAEVFMYLFFRGGAMEGFPMTDFGTITSSAEGDPSQSMQHHIRMELIVRPMTCTLAAASHTLAPVSADDLAIANSYAKESDFAVDLNCPSANVDVHLSMADANNPGSVDGQLQQAAGATATGVQVQVLRGGVPVQFGQTWSHGWSSKGLQQIPFSARYRRAAGPLVPGSVKGEAVLTADYR